jgi:hypothetical protein
MARQKRSRKGDGLPAKARTGPASPEALLEDLRCLIRQTREGVAQAVNSALVLLYWQVGHRIRTEILKSERAAYGEQIVPTLSAQLAVEFGEGFGKRNLFRMVRFAEAFPDAQIVSALSKQLGWSHFVEIIPLPLDLQRDFYAEICRVEPGASAPCEPRSRACSSSARRYRASPPSWPGRSWRHSATMIA